eukprot:6689392-Alexandrium_andersonii.AAC.1
MPFRSKYAFASDSDPLLRALLQLKHSPEELLSDMACRTAGPVPRLCVAQAPCQPGPGLGGGARACRVGGTGAVHPGER